MKISPDLDLPVDAATGAFGILATRGAGKSNAAVVMAEEMYDAGIAWVAVDPKGDWWGIRSSADGKKAGLPIIVFGGRHGDVPLEPAAGALIADLVLQQRISCVVDVSQFTKADTTRFLLAFGRHLFTHADDDQVEPIHLFLEEAHEYLPQQVKGDQAELVNVWQRIVKQGRFKGLGCTMISQRSSVLNKDVLELIDTLIVLRTGGPLSRKAIEAWVRDQDVDAGLLASLPALADGEAWVWSPGALRLMQRIRFRRRRTFDSGATPKVGETRRTPSTIADVDLAAIKEKMAETIERAKADDPKELRKRIRDLERQLAAAVPVVEERIVERLVLPEGATEAVRILDEYLASAATSAASLHALMTTFNEAPPARHRAVPAAVSVRRPTPQTGEDEVVLGKAHKAVLIVLARFPEGRNRRQVAAMAQLKSTGGHFGNVLSKLRTSGFIVGEGDGPYRITSAGLNALGTHYEPLPTGEALLGWWMSQLGRAHQAVLTVIVNAWPDAVSREGLAEAVGLDAGGGHFGNVLSNLRTRALIVGSSALSLDPDFAEAMA